MALTSMTRPKCHAPTMLARSSERTASKTSSSKRDFFSPLLWLTSVQLIALSLRTSAASMARRAAGLVLATAAAALPAASRRLPASEALR